MKRFIGILLVGLLLVIALNPISVAAKEPIPDLVTHQIVFSHYNNQIAQEIQSGVFGIVTNKGLSNFGRKSFLSISLFNDNGSLFTDITVFSENKSLDLSQVQISQGVFVKELNGLVMVYISNSDIASFSWIQMSVRGKTAIDRIDKQDLVYGRILNISLEKGISETEVDYCCNPPIKKTWYYAKVSISTEKNNKANIVIQIKIPDSELQNILYYSSSSLSNHVWISLKHYIYILEQD